jgi:hypothetical protein
MLSLLMKDETADQIHIEQRKIFNYKLDSACTAVRAAIASGQQK